MCIDRLKKFIIWRHIAYKVLKKNPDGTYSFMLGKHSQNNKMRLGDTLQNEPIGTLETWVGYAGYPCSFHAIIRKKAALRYAKNSPIESSAVVVKIKFGKVLATGYRMLHIGECKILATDEITLLEEMK